MKYLKKVSLAGKKKLPDDVKVALLNDKVKKHIFMNNIEYESELAGKPLHIKPSSLLNRLWSGIEHLPKTKRQEAITIVRKLQSSPAVQVNENFELIYNGETLRGTNILQLIRAELNTNQRSLVPGQDVFEHVLLTSPATTQVPHANLSPVNPKKRRRTSAKGKKALVKTTTKKKLRRSKLNETSLEFIPPEISPIARLAHISPMRLRYGKKVQAGVWKA